MVLKLAETDAWELLARLLRQELDWAELPRCPGRRWASPGFPTRPACTST